MPRIALTPSKGGGMCISAAALQAADIVVSTTSAGVSRVIRAATGSPISHAMLYAGHGRVVEAIGKGVVHRPLRSALAGATLGVAYRRARLTPAQAAAVISHVLNNVGKKYDTGGALGGGARANPVGCVVVVNAAVCAVAARGGLNHRDRFYCSELVIDAFRRAGAPITSIRAGVSVPQDIVVAGSNGVLEYVGHLRA